MFPVAGTLKDDAEDESFQQLSRAFDMLQEDLKRDSFTKVTCCFDNSLPVISPSPLPPLSLLSPPLEPGRVAGGGVYCRFRAAEGEVAEARASLRRLDAIDGAQEQARDRRHF